MHGLRLNSKRLKLKHTQHLVSALDLPVVAIRSDLEVMINGKLAETSHDSLTSGCYSECS